MDLVETLSFLWVYPNADKLLYQYFDDSGERKQELSGYPKRLNEDSLKLLEEKNEQWSWIFFTVNGFDEQDRKQDKVKYINAWICEIDGVDKAFQRKLVNLCPLKPSIIVESKNSYHLYWFAIDWTLENREKICNWLRNFFDGDPNVITLERVLRLPWFDHCKDPENRFPIKVKHVNECTQEDTSNGMKWIAKSYTEEQMMKAYPNFKTVAEKKKEMKKVERSMNKDDWDFRHRVSQFNCEEMLTVLSWTAYVNGDDIEFVMNTDWTKQILIDGKSTACWIDKSWFIGSKNWWWPTWIQWITWYGHNIDRKDLYKLLVNKFPELKQQKDKNKTPEEKEIDDFLVEYDREFQIDTTTPIPFTWWLPILDSEFGKIEKGRFMTTLGESWSWKTTYAFFQLLAIAKEYKSLFISLEMNGERVIELRSRKMAWITIDEWNDKNIPEQKITRMEKNKRDITLNKNLEIVWVNKKAESIKASLIIEAIKKKYMDYDFITIDNLWFIEWEGDNLYTELNDIVRQFKNFCHDYNKNVNLLHHFNKWKGDRRNRTFADVLGTGKLEHDIDYWLFVSRCLEPEDDTTPEDRAEVVLKMSKNRDNWLVKKKTVYFYKGEYHETFNPYDF